MNVKTLITVILVVSFGVGVGASVGTVLKTYVPYTGTHAQKPEVFKAWVE